MDILEYSTSVQQRSVYVSNALFIFIDFVHNDYTLCKAYKLIKKILSAI